MNYNDNELRALLAKMLPETVEDYGGGKLLWKQPIGTKGACIKSGILETELLHLASLVEAGLTEKEHYYYRNKLTTVIRPEQTLTKWSEADERQLISPSWQQRTRALAEVKGVIQ